MLLETDELELWALDDEALDDKLEDELDDEFDERLDDIEELEDDSCLAKPESAALAAEGGYDVWAVTR
jgi:hypothetical protein